MAGSSASFEEALTRFRALQLREASDALVNPDCRSILLAHAEQTRRAIVFLHGITSSPMQFKDLGAVFHARGYNVLIPRMPRHGYRDRLTHDQARISRAEYQAYASQAADIGRGLGEHFTLAGLSVSGVSAAWAAQTRADIDLAVLMSPSFAPFGVPMALMPAVTRLAKRLPNAFVWWDFKKRAAIGPTCGYPRFSTRGLAESFLLGLDVYAAARHKPPGCPKVLVITNSRDLAVSNAATRAVLTRWRAHGSTLIREYTFGRELGPLHDYIGPYQPKAQVNYVYPLVFDLIDAAGA